MKIAVTANDRFCITDFETLANFQEKPRLIRDGRFVRVGNVTYPLYCGINDMAMKIIKEIINSGHFYMVDSHQEYLT